MLHVLLHLARHDGAFTSEQIARMVDTNPVFIRRTMGGLRRAGYVHSEGGHGGGWTIARNLEEVSLLDIYSAIGGPNLFAIGTSPSKPGCGVELIVNAAVDDGLRRAESVFLEHLASLRLSDLAFQFDRMLVEAGWDSDHPPGPK